MKWLRMYAEMYHVDYDEIRKAHRMRWFARAGDGPREDTFIPRNSGMAAGHWGWDVKCKCGWESGTGGAVHASIQRDIEDHLAEKLRDAVLQRAAL